MKEPLCSKGLKKEEKDHYHDLSMLADNLNGEGLKEERIEVLDQRKKKKKKTFPLGTLKLEEEEPNGESLNTQHRSTAIRSKHKSRITNHSRGRMGVRTNKDTLNPIRSSRVLILFLLF